MKYIAAMICILFATTATPTFAHEMTNDCASKNEKIKDAKERSAAIKKCLAEVSSPENVNKTEQKDKEEHCDRNAETMKLQGKDKQDYLQHCYHESDLTTGQKDHPKAAK